MKLRAGLFVLAVGVATVVFGGAAASAASSIRPVPANFAFGERVAGMEYSSRYLDIYGTSLSMIEVTDAVLEGVDADQFELYDFDCIGNEVDEESPCLMTVNFDPTTIGVKSASIRVETAEGDPLSIPVGGTAVELAPNTPDLAAPNLNEPIADTWDLWGFAGGDFQGEGRSGVISVSQMDDSSVGTSFAYGQPGGLLAAPFGRGLVGGGFAGDAAVGDFDGDGAIDGAGSGGGTIKAYLNDGTGGMTAGTELPVDLENGVDGRLAPGDFTGDGIEDILSGYGTSEGDVNPTYGYMLQLFPGNEEGTFDDPIAQQTPIDMPNAISAGDFNGDGNLDFAAGAYDGFVYMYAGDGQGAFTQIGKFGPTCGCQSPWDVETGDFNGDGLDDVVAPMRFEDELVVYLSQADETFVRGQRLDVPQVDGWNANPYSVSVGDMNGDGKLDLITGNYMNDSAMVYVGDGDGTFSLGEVLVPDPSGFSAHGTFVGDFNGDGKADPSVASQDGDIAVYLNQGEPGQVPVPSSVQFGSVETGTESDPVTVKLENQDGLAELRVGQVTIGGGDSNDFEITGGDCLTGPVPVGRFCEIQVSFKPVGPAGSRASTIFIDTNRGSETQVSVPLSGQAADPPPPVAKIEINPTKHDFGQIQVGTSPAALSVSVKSVGTAPLEISSTTLNTTDTGDFKLESNSCSGVFQPGATCSFSVRFSPTSAGAKAATVQVISNAEVAATPVSLTGTGSATPVVKAPKVIVKKRPKSKVKISGTKLKKARIVFRSDQAGAKFQCRVDKKKFRKCKSPLVLKNVKPGNHVVRIKATKSGKTGPVKLVKFKVVRRR